MRIKSGRQSGLRKLTCHKCQALGRKRDDYLGEEDSYRLTVERGQTKRSYHQKRRTAVNVTCSRGHEFWSVHPEAVKMSREEDAAAATAPSTHPSA